MGSAEEWHGFQWIFSQWQGMLTMLLASTEPVMTALAERSRGLYVASLSILLIILMWRIGQAGFWRSLMSSGVIVLFALWGFRADILILPSGAALPMTELQATSVRIIGSVHQIFASGLNSAISSHKVSGEIIPAQAAMEDIVGRSAEVFAETDLARLIRDYNRSCSPLGVSTDAHTTYRVEDLHAIGLLGGHGLGIPESEFSVLASARKILTLAPGLSGDWKFLPEFLGDARRRMGDVVSDIEVRARRKGGEEYLKNSRRQFMQSDWTPYRLPTQSYWEAVYTGRGDVAPSYMAISAVPGQVRHGPLLGSDGQADPQQTGFTPANCLEAYQVAQAGAEQAYRALAASTGRDLGAGTAVSSEAGVIASTVAWQRFIGRSLQQTSGLSDGTTELVSGAISGYQTIKNFFAWADLQTILPMFVVLNAFLVWLTVMVGPIVLVMSLIVGPRVLLTWASIILFCLISLIVAYALTVAMSLLVATLALAQAGAAAGWSGAGAEMDALRGALGIITGIVLMLSLWISAQLTGVSAQGLSGALSSVVTVSAVSSAIGKAVGASLAAGRIAKISGGGGTGGRSGGGGGTPPAHAPNAQRRQTAAVTEALRGLSSVPDHGDNTRSQSLARPPGRR